MLPRSSHGLPTAFRFSEMPPAELARVLYMYTSRMIRGAQRERPPCPSQQPLLHDLTRLGRERGWHQQPYGLT